MSTDSQHVEYGGSLRQNSSGQEKQSSPANKLMLERYINATQPSDMTIGEQFQRLEEQLMRHDGPPRGTHTAYDMDPARFERWMRSMLFVGERSGPSENTMRRAIFSVNMENFVSFLNDEYEDVPACSVLTVTSSAASDPNAFADVAECYVRSQWSHNGVRVLDWLSQFRNRQLQSLASLKLDVEDNDLILNGWTTNRSWKKVEVFGTEEAVAKIALQLAWTMMAFRKPRPRSKELSLFAAEVMCSEDSLVLSSSTASSQSCCNFRIRVREPQASEEVEKEGACWNNAFRHFAVATGFRVPSRPADFRGVEMPFALMQILTQVDYPLPYMDGFVLKGRKSAVFPVLSNKERTAVQWHLVERVKGSCFSMVEIHKTLPDLVTVTGSLDDYVDTVSPATKRHFLGLYRDARIHLGTQDSQAEKISSVDGIPNVRFSSGTPIQWQRTINISLRVSAKAVSVGVSTEIRLGKSLQQSLSLEHNPLQLFDVACENLALLYNAERRTAWLLPEICVIFHLMQAQTRKPPNASQLTFPSFVDMEASKLEDTCRRFLAQNPNLQPIFKQFSDTFFQMKEDIVMKPKGVGLRNVFFESIERLAGVDFTELSLLPQKYSTREVKLPSKFSGGWVEMLKDNWEAKKSYKIVSIFCKNLYPEPVKPTGMECSTWYPPPVNSDYLITTISCARKLAERHGRDPVKLSPNTFWGPGHVDPYSICPKRNCNRLQQIVKQQPSKRMFNIMEDAPADGALVFGGLYCMNPHMKCSTWNAPRTLEILSEELGSEVSDYASRAASMTEPTASRVSRRQSANQATDKRPNLHMLNVASYIKPNWREDFFVAIICALPCEADAVTLLFDKFWDEDGDAFGRAKGDTNNYATGRFGSHNVVLAVLPAMGTTNAAAAAANLRFSYPNLKLTLVIGICGGIPKVGGSDVFLGDVIISKTIIQYDYGRLYPGQFAVKKTVDDSLSRANKDIRGLLASFETEHGHERLRSRTAVHLKQLQEEAVRKQRRANCYYPGITNDKLFLPNYRHLHHDSCDICCGEPARTCDIASRASCVEIGCNEDNLVRRRRTTIGGGNCPNIFIGCLGSGNTVMKSGEDRDRIAAEQFVIAFEMEGAGVWDEAPCIVVKGICDYADSHKDKKWQDFAAATAAAVAKALLERYIHEDAGRGPARRYSEFRWG